MDTDVIVAAAHRLHYFADRNVERLQLVWIDVDLVLPHESAQWRDLGDNISRQLNLGVSTIVFDEFHERHLYGDISLARALAATFGSLSMAAT